MKLWAYCLLFVIMAGANVASARVLSQEDVNSRLYYLENQETVHSLYVNGLRPSRDAEAVRAAMDALTESHFFTQQMLSETSLSNSHEDCPKYFDVQNAAYDQIIKSLDILKSSGRWGEFRDVGRFWYKKQQGTAPAALSPEVARAVIQIELLYRILPQYDSLFLQKNEADTGLWGIGSPVCITQNRDVLESMFSERLKNLEVLKLLLLGKRGVWDVRALSNSLVYFGREEAKSMQTVGFKFAGLLLVSYFAAPYVGLFVSHQFPMYASTIKTAFWGINTAVALYLGAKAGKSAWSIMNKNDNNESAIETKLSLFFEFIDTALNLPESNLSLFKEIEQYETELHLKNLQLSPSKNVQKWFNPDMEKFGTLEKVTEYYRQLSLTFK